MCRGWEEEGRTGKEKGEIRGRLRNDLRQVGYRKIIQGRLGQKGINQILKGGRL